MRGDCSCPGRAVALWFRAVIRQDSEEKRDLRHIYEVRINR